MRKIILSTLAFMGFLGLSAQTKPQYQIQYQSLAIDTTFEKIASINRQYINEHFKEAIWDIVPQKSNKKEQNYLVTLIKNQDYSRVKEINGKWRTSNCDYSFLPNSKNPVLNKEFKLTVIKDSILISADAGVADEEDLLFFKNNYYRIFDNYLHTEKTLDKDQYQLISNEKDGKLTYSLINNENTSYQPSSYLKFDKGGDLGNDFSSFNNHQTKYDVRQYDYSLRDTVDINRTINGLFKEDLTTRVIINEPYTVNYRDENSVMKDSVYFQTNVVLRGKITGFDPNTHISIDYIDQGPGSFKRKAFVFYPDKEGNFEFKMFLDKPMSFGFWHHETTAFYLAPGDDLYLTLDMKEFDETIKWTGKGSEKNQFLADRFLFEEKNDLQMRKYYDKVRQQYSKMEPQEFKDYCDSIYRMRLSFTNAYQSKLAPVDYLNYYYEQYFVNYSMKSDFPRNQSYYRKQEGKEVLEIGEDYDDFKNDFHADNDLMSFAHSYEHNIREIAFFDILTKMRNELGIPFLGLDDNYKRRNYFTGLLYSGLTNYYLKYINLGDVIERGSWDLAVEMMDDFSKAYPNTLCLNKIESSFAKAQTVAPGQLAYNFELEDLEGNKVKLSDFKGKVVYLDFWATSCGPCRGQIEGYAPKLKEMMKGKDIVFVYIACEGNVDRVKKYVEKNNVTGVLLMAKEKEPIIRDKYWFNGIPEYYIIGKDGKIVQRDADRPSSLIHNPKPLLDALNQPTDNVEEEISKL